MDNEQAKLILSAYRSSGEDMSEPFFAEALEQVRRDPALEQWFKDQMQLDHAVQAALKSEAPPAYLRDSLLLGKKVVNMETQNRHSSRSWWRLPIVRAALVAAAVLIAALIVFVVPARKSPITSERFVQQTVDIKVSGRISLGRMAKDEQVLRAWLAARKAPHRFTIPGPLDALTTVGCQTFSIDGNTVSLICFTLDRDHIVHLFVINSDRIENPPGSSPRFQQTDGVTSATWSSGGQTFVLMGAHVNEETLRQLI